MTLPPAVPDADRATFNAVSSCYFDGERPLARAVTLSVDKGLRRLEIGLPGSDIPPVEWPLREIRVLEDQPRRQAIMLRWTADPLARLHLANPDVLAHLPRPHRRAPPKGRGRLAIWAVAAVVAVALQIGVLVPLLADRLAVYIPPAGERALGEATFGQIREALDDTGLSPLALCEDLGGRLALEKMAAKLSKDIVLDQPIELHVLNHRMVNAFALPGGYVVLFRGLIDAANGPDEVAAVLAHEIGHVVSRDPTRHALRSAGSIGVLGLLLGDFAGGAAVLFLTERLISAQYSQGAEAGADIFAYDRLEGAGVSPAALGDMFDRLRQRYGDSDGITAHFLSHPSLGARIDAARAAARPDVDYQPILNAVEWRRLQGICGEASIHTPLQNLDDDELLPPSD